MIDPTKITPEKLAEMNDSLIVDNTHLRQRVAAQLVELEAISAALGTNEGHSSVTHIETLRDQLAETEEFCKGEMARSREHSSRLRQKLAAKQAEIDRLMLEYCPNEMTPEQLEEWGRNQVPAKEQGK